MRCRHVQTWGSRSRTRLRAKSARLGTSSEYCFVKASCVYEEKWMTMRDNACMHANEMPYVQGASQALPVAVDDDGAENSLR